MTNEKEMREAFEKWYSPNRTHPLEINKYGVYVNTFTQARWEAWQAALNASREVTDNRKNG